MKIPTTWQAIYNLNRDQIKNPDLIYPGQVLQMPGGGSYTVVNGDYLIKIAAGNGGGVYDPAIDPPAKSADPASSSAGTAGAKKPTNVGPGSGYQDDGSYRVESSGVTEPANDDAGKSGIQVGKAAPVMGPGKRQYNPLSKLSSYNYHLTLYMITPEAYGEFLNSNEVDPTGFTIVAESGGINRTDTNKNKAGFARDVYIDDLSLKTFVGMKSNDGPTTDSVDFEFKIYEPYGFGFISELKRLSYKVMMSSKMTGKENATFHMQQYYMLGIRFYGYDADGNVMTGDKLGTDAGTEQFALFPRYYTMQLTEVTFKLDGKATVYNIKAQNVSVQAGFGVQRGVIKLPIEVKGETVEEVMISLKDALNKQENNLVKGPPGKEAAAKAVQYANVYDFKFLDENDQIRKAKVANPADPKIKKTKAPMGADVKSTAASNEKNANPKTLTFDKNRRSFSIPGGTTIAQAIDMIIGESEYITGKIQKYKEDVVPKLTPANSEGEPFTWFVVTPICKPEAFDLKRGTYVYNITYAIKDYIIPNLRSPYVDKTTIYPGAYKRYEYIYTGKNNEILSYEQTFNNNYKMDSAQKPAAQSSPPIPVDMMTKQNESTGSSFNMGGEAAASVRTSLYSPGDQAVARMQILGDPDYLMTTMGKAYEVYEKFYGPDASIDSHAGQVFIEVKFNNAIDYDHSKGLMELDSQVEIYRYPSSIRKLINGVSYMVNTVSSTFSRGRFTQDLSMTIWTAPDATPDKDANAAAATVSSGASASPETKRPTVDAGTGKEVVPVAQPNSTTGFPTQTFPTRTYNTPEDNSGKEFVANTNASVLSAIRTVPTPVGQVADDDGSLTKKDILGVQGGAASVLSGGADRPQPRAVPTIAGIQGGGVTI
jgi:hypothetical protein